MKNELEKLPADIYKKLTEELYDAVYFVNTARKIIFWNKRAAEITGYLKKNIVGKYCYDDILKHIDKDGRPLCTARLCPLVKSIKANRPCAARVYLRRKDGIRIPVDVHIAPIRYKNKVVGAIEVFRDASACERIERQKMQNENMAFLDTLTRLPNRRWIDKRVKLELARFRRHKEYTCVAISDIDHFKKINDTYGHLAGDFALQRVAHILKENIRATDFVGRWGGEEFLVILPNTPLSYALNIFERMRRAVETARHNGHKVTISIGVSLMRARDTLKTVVRRADSALYRAKQSGRNRVVSK